MLYKIWVEIETYDVKTDRYEKEKQIDIFTTNSEKYCQTVFDAIAEKDYAEIIVPLKKSNKKSTHKPPELTDEKQRQFINAVNEAISLQCDFRDKMKEAEKIIGCDISNFNESLEYLSVTDSSIEVEDFDEFWNSLKFE